MEPSAFLGRGGVNGEDGSAVGCRYCGARVGFGVGGTGVSVGAKVAVAPAVACAVACAVGVAVVVGRDVGPSVFEPLLPAPAVEDAPGLRPSPDMTLTREAVPDGLPASPAD